MFESPTIDYGGLAPVIALTVGLVVVLLSAVTPPLRRSAPVMTTTTLGVTALLLVARWGEPETLVAGALRIDDLAIAISLIAIVAAGFAMLLSCLLYTSPSPRDRTRS